MEPPRGTVAVLLPTPDLRITRTQRAVLVTCYPRAHFMEKNRKSTSTPRPRHSHSKQPQAMDPRQRVPSASNGLF